MFYIDIIIITLCKYYIFFDVKNLVYSYYTNTKHENIFKYYDIFYLSRNFTYII